MSDSTSLAEVVGDAGVVVASDDQESAAVAMQTLSNTMDNRRSLTQRVMEHARKFAWTHTAEQLRRGIA